MTFRHKELRKFSRRELLEILVSQSKEIDRLQAQLAAANSLLESREITIKNAGSMAEAALQLNHIFQDADAAARQYLDSIKLMVQKEWEVLNQILEKERVLHAKLEKANNEGGQPAVTSSPPGRRAEGET